MLPSLVQLCNTYSSSHGNAQFFIDQYRNATEYYVPLKQLVNVTENPFYVSTILAVKAPTHISAFGVRFKNFDVGTGFAMGILGYFLLLVIFSAVHNFSRKTLVAKSINSSSVSKLCQKFIIFRGLIPKGEYSEALELPTNPNAKQRSSRHRFFSF